MYVNDQNDQWMVENNGFITIINYMPVTLLSIAISINVRNWTYYYIKIEEMVQFSKLDVYAASYLK